MSGIKNAIYKGLKGNMTKGLREFQKGDDVKTLYSFKIPKGKKAIDVETRDMRQIIKKMAPIMLEIDKQLAEKVRINIDEKCSEYGIDKRTFCFQQETEKSFLEYDSKKKALKKEETNIKSNAEEKKENNRRTGKMQIFDENGNLVIQEYIDPTLLEKKITLPSGFQILAKQYIQENFVPYIPESGTFKLKNGVVISARQYIEEFLLFEGQEKYNGDIEELLRNTVDSEDSPPKKSGWTEKTHGQERITMSDMKIDINKAKVTKEEVEKTQDRIKEDKLVQEYKTLSRKKSFGSISPEEQARMDHLLTNVQGVREYQEQMDARKKQRNNVMKKGNVQLR